MWPFKSPTPAPSPVPSEASAGLLERLDAVERGLKALQLDFLAWEQGAAKITKEMSRTLRSMAELDRRERQRRGDELGEMELTDPEEPDLLQRTLTFGRRSNAS